MQNNGSLVGCRKGVRSDMMDKFTNFFTSGILNQVINITKLFISNQNFHINVGQSHARGGLEAMALNEPDFYILNFEYIMVLR